MLPNPFSPSTTFASFFSALKAHLTSRQAKIFVSFWILGLINNVLYVIILSAALDLVGPAIPKSLVLLFDVAPSFFLKLVAPYFLHRISYNRRVAICVLLASVGMALVALTPPHPAAVATKMIGIILASLSSGGGELSFLALTSFYGPTALAAWGSGTGGAGLVGAGAYLLATTTLGLSVRTSLLTFSFLPLAMLAAYFFILPQHGGPGISPRTSHSHDGHHPDVAAEPHAEGYVPSDHDAADERADLLRHGSPDDGDNESSYLSDLPSHAALLTLLTSMLPLFLVYLAEYTINQGVTPTLLFPLPTSPFARYRDFYPAYGFVYQAGVFVSRSSLPFIRVQHLYLPSILQVVNLALLSAHALNMKLLPNVWVVFAIVFWEGLLGGIVYVSTFRRIGEEVPSQDKEFSLAATTVSDSGGILLASFLGMGVETGLCRWQVDHGRDWCTRL
ncbi:hypothetical protein ANO11243_024290 [Dothideomycetidae sp. 11243]|nr:hypothetical protein ANO11243_024290 [fungal sp. No.11243]